MNTTSDNYRKEAADYVTEQLLQHLTTDLSINERLGLIAKAHRDLQGINAGSRYPAFDRVAEDRRTT